MRASSVRRALRCGIKNIHCDGRSQRYHHSRGGANKSYHETPTRSSACHAPPTTSCSRSYQRSCSFPIFNSTGIRVFSSRDFDDGSAGFEGTHPLPTDAKIQYRNVITDIVLGSQDCPIGSMEPDLIKDTEDALLSWVDERSTAGLETSLNLLRRLIQEQEAQEGQLRNEFRNDDTAPIVTAADDFDVHLNPQQNWTYSVRPFLVSRVMDCWRTCWIDGTTSMDPSSMLHMLVDFETRGVAIDNRPFSMIIEGMLKRGDAFETPLLAQWVLDQRVESADGSPELRPDTFLFTDVVRAWANSGRVEAPEMAEGTLDLMNDFYENGWVDSGPSLVTYSAAMTAWERSRRHDSAESVERLLEKLKTSTIPDLEPTSVIYSHVIRAWANSRDPNGAAKAWEYLQEMIELYEAGEEGVVPDELLFGKVMFALGRNGDPRSAVEVFERLEDLYERSGNAQLKPSNETKRSFLFALSKIGDSEIAQGLLDEMIDEAVNEDGPMPRRSYFIDLLVSWTKERDYATAAKESDKLLRRMVDLARSGFVDVMPDVLTFQKVAKAWSRVRKRGSDEKALSLLELLRNVYRETGSSSLKPTSKFVEIVVLALCHSPNPDSLKIARSIVNDMEKDFSRGDSDMKPSRGVYTSLMQAWVRNGKDSHEAVMELFDKLQALYLEGDPDYQPDLLVYNSLLESWALSGNASKVHSLLMEMVGEFERGNNAVKPDTQVFNKHLKAISLSRDPDRFHQAETAFNMFHELRSRGLKLEPDGHSFVHMIRIWCSCQFDVEEATTKADFYLHSMVENGFEPSFGLYVSLIRLWLKKGGESGTMRASALLEDLLTAVHSRRIQPPKARTYHQLLSLIGESNIPRRSQQAKKLLASHRGDKVPRLLMPAD